MDLTARLTRELTDGVIAGLDLQAFGEGSATPAPVAPTDRLVIGGMFRFVRNPMYLAVVTILLDLSALSPRRPCGFTPSWCGGDGGVRPLVRGAGPRHALRTAVRGLPTQRPSVVAEAHTTEFADRAVPLAG